MKLNHLLLLPFLFLILFNCENNSEENKLKTYEHYKKFDKYISEVSHGVISSRSNINIILVNALSKKEIENFNSNIIDVTPKPEELNE